MSRFEAMFSRLQVRAEKALIGYLTVGDPGLVESEARCETALAAGVDALELGIPYSDPLADGPVIQAAGQRALAAGFRLEWLWQILRHLRERHPDTPLAIMTYVNPVLQVGMEKFVSRAAAEGADALIVPDLPPEEEKPLLSVCRNLGLDLIPFVAPTTPLARMREVLPGHSGFVYCVSITGVTGTQLDGRVSEAESRPIDELLAQARAVSGLPVSLGFGIYSAADIRRFGREADGVIVGSALVRIRSTAELGEFVRSLKEATRADSQQKRVGRGRGEETAAVIQS
ncbi:MAG: tryptophan synthase subunit alpha [Limnochordales bacterium]|nr:tryptophan synthase subunit alpha [Limnochordales bacterium]